VTFSKRHSAMVSSFAIAVALAAPAMAQTFPFNPGSTNSTTLTAGPENTVLGVPSNPIYTPPAVPGGNYIGSFDRVDTTSTGYNTSGSSSFYDSSIGQLQSTSFDLNGAQSAATTTTYTTEAIPDGLGGFTLSGPPVASGSVIGSPIVSDVSVAYDSRTLTTAMNNTHVETVSSSGNTAVLAGTYGSVSTSGTTYLSATGTAVFNPATGEMVSTIDSVTGTTLDASGLTSTGGIYLSAAPAAGPAALLAAPYATLTSAGLDTNGSVSANSITANTITGALVSTASIDAGGFAITNVGNGVALTDAANIGQVNTAVAVETTRATGAETVLTTAITTEVSDRQAAIATEVIDRNAAVAVETTRATGAETVLTTAISTEASTRATADTSLQNAINTEASDRATAVSAEASARTAADTALGASITSEMTARLAADTAINGRIDGLSGRVDSLSGRVDYLDKKIAASTAVAVALSGSTFLPDVHFNLTANVATYDGAQAGAIQVGYLVSRHVALNGGVAFGFSTGGKTAGRVGVTFGW
jgi:hypothetical protein